MKRLHLFFLVTLLWLCLPPQLRAQTDSSLLSAADSSAALGLQNPLFIHQDVLEFKLLMDARAVLKDRGEDRKDHKAVISYKSAEGTVVEEKLKVKVRGNRRRDPSVCNFPPLQLNFSRKTVENTMFGKVNKLKMVTHCINDEFVLREYLVYKVYNALTDTSYRVRLCRVVYEDTKGKRKTETRYAFLIEDDAVMAARHNARVIPDEVRIGMDKTELLSMAKVAFFQFMIGNTDWSVPYRHNVDLLSFDSLAPPVPVPYDFDYAGIVSTPYASPPPELGISSVRQRLFRGYSYPEEVYAEVQKHFNSRRAAIYAVYRDFDLLDERYTRQTLKYLDQFYSALNNKRDFYNAFVRVGQRNERSRVVVKGLD
ncbi:hypothetical protein [Pontibacter litorisediminis]|uniref:hypothetical protein n=1 Tax=Pontibacter litorisediminis TaxID=1846260 RepID=UPI0023EABE28|nr:hypothetical protein [Pontibacter litorisediminis]